jgi:hypothetical protein
MKSLTFLCLLAIPTAADLISSLAFDNEHAQDDHQGSDNNNNMRKLGSQSIPIVYTKSPQTSGSGGVVAVVADRTFTSASPSSAIPATTTSVPTPTPTPSHEMGAFGNILTPSPSQAIGAVGDYMTPSPSQGMGAVGNYITLSPSHGMGALGGYVTPSPSHGLSAVGSYITSSPSQGMGAVGGFVTLSPSQGIGALGEGTTTTLSPTKRSSNTAPTLQDDSVPSQGANIVYNHPATTTAMPTASLGFNSLGQLQSYYPSLSPSYSSSQSPSAWPSDLPSTISANAALSKPLPSNEPSAFPSDMPSVVMSEKNVGPVAPSESDVPSIGPSLILTSQGEWSSSFASDVPSSWPSGKIVQLEN